MHPSMDCNFHVMKFINPIQNSSAWVVYSMEHMDSYLLVAIYNLFLKVSFYQLTFSLFTNVSLSKEYYFIFTYLKLMHPMFNDTFNFL